MIPPSFGRTKLLPNLNKSKTYSSTSNSVDKRWRIFQCFVTAAYLYKALLGFRLSTMAMLHLTDLTKAR